MEHLALEIFDLATAGSNQTSSKFAVLSDDVTISITDTSEIFASGDLWSYSFTLNVQANAHIFGTAGDMHGSRLHEQVNKRRARLWIEGIPLYLGYLTLGDEEDVDENGNVNVGFESGKKTFEDMIEGSKANQVPMMGKVRFGVALWTKRKIELETQVSVSAHITGKSDREGTWTRHNLWDISQQIITLRYTADGEREGDAVQEYPRMVFPKGRFENQATLREEDVDCLNTDYPYDDGHPYCNIALCYQKYGYDKKMPDGRIVPDYGSDPEAQRGYEYMPANRVNSAPNFYVIYWIRALMKHLGIHIEENQMMGVEDLRRLFFVNTNCAYKMPKIIRGENYDREYTRYKFSRDESHNLRRYITEQDYGSSNPDDVIGVSFDSLQVGTPEIYYHPSKEEGNSIYDIAMDTPKIQGVSAIHVGNSYLEDNSWLHDAYATPDCFPNVEISEVVKAIENGFGIRFLFSDDFQRVRIVLLRSIFRSSEIQDVACDIISESKTENSIRGFRLTYGDNKENTEFYYKGFADKLPHKKPYFTDDSDKHDYSHWELDAAYGNIIKKVSAFDKTCYVTPNTGDAYGIKIDKDAKRYKDLHPSLFEFAGYMDAEDGDCSGDDDSIHEISMGFTPAIMNDLNMEEERKADSDADRKQRFALFLDETMRPRRPDLKDLPDEEKQPGVKSYDDSNAVYSLSELYAKYGPGSTEPMVGDDGVVKPGEFAIASDTYFEKTQQSLTLGTIFYERWLEDGWTKTEQASITYPVTCDFSGYVLEGYRLYLQDNYEPTDEGISPIEKHDWGLMLGIMRGSGSDAVVDYQSDLDDHDDDYQNDTWEIVPGSSATAHPDTCDNYGNEWKYTGSREALPQDAAGLYDELFPDANASFAYVRNDGVDIFPIRVQRGITYLVLMRTPYPPNNPMLERRFRMYVGYLAGRTEEDIMRIDAQGYMDYQNTIVEMGSSYERCDTCRELIRLSLGLSTSITIDIGGTASQFGRFSLKLRAEKPNPYYVASLPDIVRTKKEAGKAMEKLYTTSDTNLLTRPHVSNATMRAAGWDCPGDGYATVYSMGYGVQYADGTVHEILWTPIRENGRIMTPQQLEAYVNTFNGIPPSQLANYDTYHLILDVNTTEIRAEKLHELQALYYAGYGTETASVDITPINRQYLDITSKNLRRRGVMDALYKEYSFWMRNARIAKLPVRMELAQLLAIDKTKKVRVGDITGFIRKIQYSVSNKTGLGEVTMEIMYI